MFVFPMAGVSKRFTDAGYTLPKYMLEADGQSVFSHVINGFRDYFDEDAFLFICRDIAGTPRFVTDECHRLGLTNFQIIALDAMTRGQAETVAFGVTDAGLPTSAPLTIFNVDTIHAGFKYPGADVMERADGYLEVFRGVGDAWSFARTKSETDMTVVETAEKKRISPLCSSGLYHFKQASDFLRAFRAEASRPADEWAAKELYIAPLYNHLIADGKKVMAVEIPTSSLTPCGIPAEYEALKKGR